MPLALMCGFPASGKTKRASELKHYLEKSSGKVVHVIGDQSLGVNKNTVYEGTTTICPILTFTALTPGLKHDTCT